MTSACLPQPLRTRRGDRGLREVATTTSVSASTLSQLENGEIPDMDTFLVLSSWTGWPTSTFLHQDQERATVQFVEEALREDGVLEAEIIKVFLVLLTAVRGV